MAVRQTITNVKEGVTYPDAYRNISVKDYSDHKVKVCFTLKTYSSQAHYDAHLNDKHHHKLDYDKQFILMAKLPDGVTDNPVFSQYLGNLTQAGKDLIGQLYEYLKNETTELAGAVDILD